MIVYASTYLLIGLVAGFTAAMRCLKGTVVAPPTTHAWIGVITGLFIFAWPVAITAWIVLSVAHKIWTARRR